MMRNKAPVRANTLPASKVRALFDGLHRDDLSLLAGTRIKYQPNSLRTRQKWPPIERCAGLLQPVGCWLRPNSPSPTETLTFAGFRVVATPGSSLRKSRAMANRAPRASLAAETASHDGGRGKTREQTGAPLGWVPPNCQGCLAVTALGAGTAVFANRSERPNAVDSLP